MSEPSSQIIAIWVSNSDVPNVSRLYDVIFNVLKQTLQDWSDERIYEISEKHEKYVFDILLQKFDEIVSSGDQPSFKIEDDSGTFYYSSSLGKEKPIIKKIIEDSPEKFELLCKTILEKLGAKSEVVGGTDDGGVDFIAYELPMGGIKLKTKTTNQLLVIGQAKRLQNDTIISEKRLREFVGASVKKRYDLLVKKEYNTRYIQPTVYAFWTTADFDTDAREYAKSLGLWLLNGIGVAQLIIELNINI